MDNRVTRCLARIKILRADLQLHAASDLRVRHDASRDAHMERFSLDRVGVHGSSGADTPAFGCVGR